MINEIQNTNCHFDRREKSHHVMQEYDCEILRFARNDKFSFAYRLPARRLLFLMLAGGLPTAYCLLPTVYCLLLLSCQTDIQTINQLTIGKNLPSETMKGAEIIYSDSAKVKMKLTGEQLDRYNGEKPHIIFPLGVRVLFYDDSMKVSTQLKADYGIRYESDGKMEAKRNVEVVNVKGEKLNTEHLIFDESKDRIYTEEFVRITTASEVIYGDGLESNQDFTKYRIRNIKGTIQLEE